MDPFLERLRPRSPTKPPILKDRNQNSNGVHHVHFTRISELKFQHQKRWSKRDKGKRPLYTSPSKKDEYFNKIIYKPDPYTDPDRIEKFYKKKLRKDLGSENSNVSVPSQIPIVIHKTLPTPKPHHFRTRSTVKLPIIYSSPQKVKKKKVRTSGEQSTTKVKRDPTQPRYYYEDRIERDIFASLREEEIGDAFLFLKEKPRKKKESELTKKREIEKDLKKFMEPFSDLRDPPMDIHSRTDFSFFFPEKKEVKVEPTISRKVGKLNASLASSPTKDGWEENVFFENRYEKSKIPEPYNTELHHLYLENKHVWINEKTGETYVDPHDSFKEQKHYRKMKVKGRFRRRNRRPKTAYRTRTMPKRFLLEPLIDDDFYNERKVHHFYDIPQKKKLMKKDIEEMRMSQKKEKVNDFFISSSSGDTIFEKFKYDMQGPREFSSRSKKNLRFVSMEAKREKRRRRMGRLIRKKKKEILEMEKMWRKGRKRRRGRKEQKGVRKIVLH